MVNDAGHYKSGSYYHMMVITLGEGGCQLMIHCRASQVLIAGPIGPVIVTSLAKIIFNIKNMI